MTQAWRTELRAWANEIAHDFSQRDHIIGVLIGGSIARGQEWQHSDLELGILLEEKDPNIPYFNVIKGRGVEVIQLAAPDVRAALSKIDSGDLSPIADWPIQLWKGKVIHDPSGLYARFKDAFDPGLFTPAVVGIKLANLQTHIEQTLAEARQLLEQQPAAALTRARYAMNEAILALHWSYGELPRSQNRTDSRLRRLCVKYDNPTFYQLYRDVFALEETRKATRVVWPKVRDQVLAITNLWGGDARDFFDFAVDSHFQWRQSAGILTVYRLYVPIIGGEAGIFNKLDQPEWANANPDLLAFLGLTHAQPDAVQTLINRLTRACNEIFRPSA
ncbi:MAG: hypothetical protein JW750_08265 [Anaerolineaceae bacterium]|nr:hypothetical protein [Anaerolineaceae bacterium]